MYKITVKCFDEDLDQSGYNREKNSKDVYEQVLETLDVNKLAVYLNTKLTNGQKP
jgi:hypothetical protein